MDAGTIAALITAVTGLVGAVGALVAVLRHAAGPAHQAPASTPVDSAGPGTPPPVA